MELLISNFLAGLMVSRLHLVATEFKNIAASNTSEICILASLSRHSLRTTRVELPPIQYQLYNIEIEFRIKILVSHHTYRLQ